MKIDAYQTMCLFERDEPSFNYGKIILFNVADNTKKTIGFWHVESCTLFAKVSGVSPLILPAEAAQQLQMQISIVDMERA